MIQFKDNIMQPDACISQLEKSALRKEKIKARNELSAEERTVHNKKIIDYILESQAFQDAQIIMLYRSVKGEVDIRALEREIAAKKKTAVFPLCISDSEMISLLPKDASSWQGGYHGIEEPVRELSIEINPENIDLMICPCTVFDEKGHRMGMGGGFYDRFLPKCIKAVKAAVAYEVQRAEAVPVHPWDVPMDLIFTEQRCINVKGTQVCSEHILVS